MAQEFHSVELFAGVGGLARGMEEEGFRPLLLVERHPPALAVLRGGGGPALERDVREVDWAPWAGRVDVLTGGPPCQPFSGAGRGLGQLDPRDMWPEAVRAVRELRPRAFAFENVPGLLRPAHAGYVEAVRSALESPGGEARPTYEVRVVLANAADHGAAQDRRRVLFLGRIREGEGRPFPSLAPTHSRHALVRALRDGSYARARGLCPGELALPARLPAAGPEDGLPPWRTLRDALAGLGEPDGRDGHVAVPGARRYPGHDGSPLDWPAKTLKAGVHGVPGGENMLRRADGSVRYLTVREAARLTGFPDHAAFPVSRSEALRGLGNAVPVPLARAVARWLREALGG